eukprot:TRINITY_DN10420_c0_g1_i1.p1 TRINITY_DN10420_c0_g1~~TRINITY_DN10420_c0_g1_i1.p1  ORF type:complete len:427 (+),score=72.59 TRINITY_DN10420_c0_g1_i1:85-1281(+)
MATGQLELLNELLMQAGVCGAPGGAAALGFPAGALLGLGMAPDPYRLQQYAGVPLQHNVVGAPIQLGNGDSVPPICKDFMNHGFCDRESRGKVCHYRHLPAEHHTGRQLRGQHWAERAPARAPQPQYHPYMYPGGMPPFPPPPWLRPASSRSGSSSRDRSRPRRRRRRRDGSRPRSRRRRSRSQSATRTRRRVPRRGERSPQPPRRRRRSSSATPASRDRRQRKRRRVSSSRSAPGRSSQQPLQQQQLRRSSSPSSSVLSPRPPPRKKARARPGAKSRAEPAGAASTGDSSAAAGAEIKGRRAAAATQGKAGKKKRNEKGAKQARRKAESSSSQSDLPGLGFDSDREADQSSSGGRFARGLREMRRKEPGAGRPKQRRKSPDEVLLSKVSSFLGGRSS